MASTAAKTKTRQDVCIDLPGETVQCWRSSDNVKVTLRKHRDVIFELNLGESRTYTVQATESDFYSARDKKLIYAKHNGNVTFKDGERLHLWVTRNFKGSLELKCGGVTLMKLSPNEVDQHRYDDAAKTKPAPIIVVLGQSKPNDRALPATANHVPQHAAKLSTNAISTPTPHAAPTGEDCSLICVVERTLKGMPEQISKYFTQGGAKSGLVEIDPNEIATRNWIWGQVAGASAYALDNWEWLRASLDSKTHDGFKLVKAKIHLVRGKAVLYFSGYSRFNQVFGPGGFNPSNPRVMNIFSGAGSLSSSALAMSKNVANSFRGNALISLIFSSYTAYAEWREDVKKDGYDLAAALIVAVLKAVLSAILVGVFVALICTFLLAGALTAIPIIVVGALTVGLGVIVNYGVDKADKVLGKLTTNDPKNGDGMAASLAPLLRDAGNSIAASWDKLVSTFPSDYSAREAF
jgi:hypothetical protein